MYDVIVVGGGPIGMNAVIALAQENLKVALFDVGDALGGQLSVLYPEKEIVDLPHIPSIMAKDYIALLEKKIAEYPHVEIHLKSKVTYVESITDGVLIHVNDEKYTAKKLLITTGLGAFIPRTMGLEGEQTCDNILYALDDLQSLQNKHVLVLGGGDSALDWTKEISRISDEVVIIHRRREFRGNFATIANLPNVIVKTPFIPLSINKKDGHLLSLTIKNVETDKQETLIADYVFVNYGYVSANEFFGLANVSGGIVVDSLMKTSKNHIYAIGDIARYDNKIRRIAPGLHELEIFLQNIKENE